MHIFARVCNQRRRRSIWKTEDTTAATTKKRAHKKKTLSRLRFLLCAPAPAAPPHHIAFCLFIFISALMLPHHIICSVYTRNNNKNRRCKKNCPRRVARATSLVTIVSLLRVWMMMMHLKASRVQMFAWRPRCNSHYEGYSITKGAHQTTKTAATRQQQQQKILSSVCWMLCGGGDKSTSTRWALCLIHMLSARAFVCVLTENQDRTTRKIIVCVCC